MDIAELNNKIGYILSFLSAVSQPIKTKLIKQCTMPSKHGALYPRAVDLPDQVDVTDFRCIHFFIIVSGAGFRLLRFCFLKRIIIHHAVSLRKQLFQTVRRLAGYILNGDALADVGSVVRMALRGINVQIPDELVVDDKTLGFVFARPLRFVSQYTNYPTTNLFAFFKNFAGIGRSSCQVIFIGLLPVCFT